MACQSCNGQGCGGASPSPPSPRNSAGEGGATMGFFCSKCRVPLGGPEPPTCAACLHSALLAKFKTAVNANGLIADEEQLLLAFSGGAASRAALALLQDIRGAGRERRGLKGFGVAAVFVDESAALRLSPAAAQAALDCIASAVGSDVNGKRGSVPLHVVRLECVFEDEGGDSGDAERRLAVLFQSVEDPTGKEDLLEYLRVRAIQRVARERGFTKVVSAECATRLAARVIAATSKGRGFALPAEIQYMDARWEVPLVHPLRDCTARDLAAFCHFSKFTTTAIEQSVAGSAGSLNGAAQSFVNVVQEENSSREQTIVRTAAKLKCFAFNEVVPPPNRRRRNPLHSNELSRGSDFDMPCSICGAPLDVKDAFVPAIEAVDEPLCRAESTGNSLQHFLEFRSTCCPSCRFQILSEDDEVKGPKTYGLLPRDVREMGGASFEGQRNWMRSQIESFLLPEEVHDGNEAG